MEELIKQASAFNFNLQVKVIINRASTNPSVNESIEAKEILQDSGNLELMDFIVRDRIAFRKAAKAGKSVFELSPIDDKAIKEMDALYDLIISRQELREVS